MLEYFPPLPRLEKKYDEMRSEILEKDIKIRQFE